jgi:DNA-directed RNA polymerase specialized sigma24 family protein
VEDAQKQRDAVEAARKELASVDNELLQLAVRDEPHLETKARQIQEAIRLALALDQLTDAQREALLLGATLQGERRDLVAELLVKLWPRNEELEISEN